MMAAPVKSGPRIGEVLNKLRKVRRGTKPGQWTALCPAHDDHNPSLSISVGDNDRVLLTCHARCSYEAIVDALALDRSPSPRSESADPLALKRAVRVYDYTDAHGNVLYKAARYEPKNFRPFSPDGSGDWKMGLGKHITRVPYRLQRLRAARPDELVLLLEGEKDVERAEVEGFTATTTQGGAKNWRSHADMMAYELKGRRVAIVPDADDAGDVYATDALATLAPVAASAAILRLPRLEHTSEHGLDLSDWFTLYGGTSAELRKLAEAALSNVRNTDPTVTSADDGDHADGPVPIASSEDNSEGKPGRAPSMASQLVTLAASAGLFHDSEGTTWATIAAESHRETWPLHSKSFKRWLARRLYESEGKTPNAQALQDALTVLDGKATFDGPTEPVSVRVAERDGVIYLDLADEQWRAVKVTANGWEIVSGDDLPVHFRRSKGMLPLPSPALGGRIGELRAFVNLGGSEDEGRADWTLLVAWLLGALKPTGPYPVLALSGEQGSAKSTTARLLRMLIDPNIAALRSEPKELRDLAIAANNSWAIVLDNLSGMPAWLSDALCRLSTGGGSAYRTLYENDDETIFNAQRPIILTGIEEVATRGDLVDRAILLSLPTIPDDKRQPESAFWAAFEGARAAILGSLLSAVAGAMRTLPATHLDRLPRMADFALWATAAEPALGWEKRAFLTAYTANRKNANDLTLEASLVAGALLAFIHPGATWKGSMGELHAELLASNAGLADKHGWPATARGLSGAIARVAPNLRAVGFTITPARAGHTRKREYTITRPQQEEDADKPSAPSASSAEAPKAEINEPPVRTVLRTVGDDADDMTVRTASDRPHAKAQTMRKADDADGADGTLPLLSNGRGPVCGRCRAPKLLDPQGGYILTCDCGTQVSA